MQKMRQGGQSQTSFLVFKDALCKLKGSAVSTLVLIYFVRPRLGHTIKTNLITFQTVDQ